MKNTEKESNHFIDSGLEKIKLLNIEINNVTISQLLSNLNTGVLVTPNVDHLVKLQKDTQFLECYKMADWVICDSKILNLAAKFIGKPFKEVIPGSSFLPAFYNFHKDNLDVKIFLLGAAPGVAKSALEKINSYVGRTMVVGEFSPTYGFENNSDECDRIVEIIQKSNANILVVGLGAPKQEKWIFKYKSQLSNIDIFMALGATIDFEAGNVKRAPQIFQKFHAEWMYRLYKEPKRLWKRYLVDDMPFFYLILKQKLGLYQK